MKDFKKWSVCLALSLVSATTFAFGLSHIALAEDAAPEESPDTVVYDGVKSDITLGTAETNGVTGTTVYAGTFGYGCSTVFGEGSTDCWSGGLDPSTALVIAFAELDAEAYPTMTIRMAVGSWTEGVAGETLLFFGTQTTLSAETAVASEAFAQGNTIKELTFETADFADEDGNISSLTFMRTKQSGQIFIDYIRFEKAEELEDTVVYDGVESDITLGTAETNGVTGTTVYAGAFVYSCSGVFGADTTDCFSGDLEPSTALVIAFKALDAEAYPTMTIRMAVGTWAGDNETLLFFGTQTTLSAETAVWSEDFAYGNTVKEITLKTADFAGEDGSVSSLTFMRTKQKGQIFIDYIRFEKASAEAASLYLLGGDVIAEKNPASLADENVTWLKLAAHESYPTVGYVDRPAFVSYNGETLPGFEVTEGTTPIIKAKNVVVAIDVGHLKASDYAQLRLTYFFTDWAFGYHTFYVYGSGTTSFTDGDGNPVGYALSQNNHGPESKHEIKISDLSQLADSKGYIDYIYILYGGEISGNGCFSGSQLWLNEVTFLIEDDVPAPVVSEEYTTKDVSELLPVGDGVTFDLESNGAQAGEEGFGAYTRAAAAQTAAADVITFNFTPDYAEDAEYSVYFLLKAEKTSDYTNGGLLFWFAGSNILIGNGVKGDYAQIMKADYPAGAFESGSSTKVTLAAIPYYVEGVREGYYLAVYLNDAETPIVEKYIPESETVLGDYTTIVLQDLGKDYGVRLTSAFATATAAAEVMNVKVETTGNKTTFDKPRAALTLSHFYVEGESVSELMIEGDATYNAETKTLTFGSEGTVKVYYTVTNAFGTFKSNELELTYDDGVEDETPGSSRGCGSVIGGLGFGGLAVAAAGVALALKKKRD